MVVGEADIHSDDWFLTCHFVDDRVMPGTLMFECCLHTLRVFLLRLGWIARQGEIVLEPVPGVASRLKCRGQVLDTTRRVSYEISIKEIGYRPEPYVIADALMYADGKPIVEITDMSLRYAGATKETFRQLWTASEMPVRKPAIFDTDRILAFAIGKPSDAFGEPYRLFDQDRVIARLPGPPYQFLDRVTEIRAEPWKILPGGECEAQYDVPPDAWYFADNRQDDMPFGVLLEIALQPCGWLAGYMGSALTSEVDLSFRNLGGTATQLARVEPGSGTLSVRVKLTRASSSAGMIIQFFDYEVLAHRQPVYRGNTYFGFFPKVALLKQEGLKDPARWQPSADALLRGRSLEFPQGAPFPRGRLRLLDRVTCWIPDGGPKGLGYLRATRRVVPDEWFFKAHFHQDPVVPGSLGLESFLQLLKFIAAERWGGGSLAKYEAVAMDQPHEWIYRGQVIPANREVTVEAMVTAVDEQRRLLRADGYLSVDGRVIYGMKEFTLRQRNR
jgi:3-hydroxymyristoyl/3-hydroxydecanoyl-(acyl carrier protein) dehydratase